MANPSWTLQGTLVDGAGKPVAGTTIIVSPPGVPYNTPWGSVIVDPVSVTSDSKGYFAIQVASIAECRWSIKVANADSVLIPDPGPNAVVDVRLITPAYVPQSQGGKKIAQGVGITGVSFTSDSKLLFSLGNGMSLPALDIPSLTHDVQSVAGKQGDVTLTADDITDGEQRWGAAVVNTSSEKGLTPFRKAVGSGSATVAVVGGSSTEGAGVSILDKRWQDTLRDSLRQTTGLTANTGVGYIPARYATGGLYPTPRLMGTEGTDYAFSTHSGLGNRGVEMKTSGCSVVYTGREVRFLTIHWLSSSTKVGVFRVTVGKSSPITINTAGGDDAVGKMTVDLGVVSSKDIKVTWVSGNPVFEGLTLDTASTGLMWRDATHGGFTVGNFLSGVGSDKDMARLGLAALTSAAPDLVILNLGTDDMAVIREGLAESWKSKLGDYLTALTKAIPNAGILLVHDPMRPEDARSATPPSDDPKKLRDFELAARQAIAALPNASALFLSDLWSPINTSVKNPTTPVEQDPIGWLADRRNPSDVGNDLISSHLTEKILGGLEASRVTSLSSAVSQLAAQTKGGDDGDYVEATQLDAMSAALISSSSGTLLQTQGDLRWVLNSELDNMVERTVSNTDSATRFTLNNVFASQKSVAEAKLSSQRNARAMTVAQKAASAGTLRVAVIGDEKAEGAGASAKDKRWVDLLQKRLREKFDPTQSGDQGAGYVPALYSTPLPQVASISGTENTDWSRIDYEAGPGIRSVELMTAAATITYPSMSFRYLTVHYTKRSTAGVFTVSDESGVVDTINVSSTTTTSAQKVIDFGSWATRSVTIKATSGTPRVAGCLFQTSLTGGVTVADFAHSGHTVEYFARGMSYKGDSVSDDYNLQSLSGFDPHLVVVALGMNDMAGPNWGQQPFDPSAYEDNWKMLVAKIHAAAPKAGILALHSAMRVEDARRASSNDYPEKLQIAENAMRRAIDTDALSSAISESELWQPTSSSVANADSPVEQDPLGWLNGPKTPSDFGHDRIASYVTDKVAAGVSSVIASGAQTGAAFANMLADPDSAASVTLSHTYVRQDCLAGLTAWRVAYHTRGLKAARIMVLSGHEGVGATTTATRFTKLLQDRLRKGEPGGLGWVNAAQSVASIPKATTVTGPTKVYTVGKGISGTTLNLDNGATATFPATTCTSVKVYYTKQATFAGNADVLIDGTKVGTLSSVGGDIDGQVATFTVTRGSHVVSIQGVADGANNFPLEAVEFFDGDENSGVHVIDATTQDQKIKDMTTTWYSWDTGRWVATRALNPDLILVYAGDADWLANGIAFIDTAVQALIDKIKNSTTGPNSILFVMPPRPVPKSGSQAGTPEEYAYLQKLLQSVALANPDHVAFFDMGTQWPRLQAGDSGLGLMSDPANPQHYSDKGNTFLAAILANLLAG